MLCFYFTYEELKQHKGLYPLKPAMGDLKGVYPQKRLCHFYAFFKKRSRIKDRRFFFEKEKTRKKE